MDHYCCYTVHMTKTKTKSLRFVDTLTWISSKVVMPVPMSTDRAIVATNDLTIVLLNPSTVSPLALMDNTT